MNWKEGWNNAVLSLANGQETNVTCPMSSSHMKDGRGNIAPATIILPTLAMEARRKAEKENNLPYVVDYFMDILEKAIEDCKDELIERFNWICAQDLKSAKFMYENNTFYSHNDEVKKEGIKGALKHGTLAIGQIGLAECLQILVGCDHTENRGMEVAQSIEKLFKTKCAEYKENYKLNFGVYFTPAENLCNTSYKKFVKKYGLIENVTAYKDYSFDSIKDSMLKEFEKKNNRKASEEEIQEIEKFLKSK